MNVVVLGLNHRSAAVETRERFAVGDGMLAEAFEKFSRIEGVEESVILSTCNRVEFYAAGTGLASGFHGFNRFLQEHSGLGTDSLDVLYRYDLPHSAAHLFRVACGIDSMVLGETEILGQVKKAYAQAMESGRTSRALNRLFQSAFRVSKHVRARTGINRGSTSVGSVAVELAGRIFGDLSKCQVLILGAGETAERTARSLQSRGAGGISVTNRSLERAEAMAQLLEGQSIAFDAWQDMLWKYDIVIGCTAAEEPILKRSRVEAILHRRAGRPLFLIDLAVPRDIEASVNQIDNVYLYDIDSLEQIARQSLEERQRDVLRCEEIIGRDVGEFQAWLAREHARLGGRPISPPAGGALRAGRP